MNTVFKLGGCYELEVTSDGSLAYRTPNMSSAGAGKGNIGFLLHYHDQFPRPVDAPEAPEWETKVAISLKRNQARAIASALLSAVSEAGE